MLFNKTKKQNKTKPQSNYTGEIPNTPLRFLWYVAKQHKIWLFLSVSFVIIASGISQSTSYFFKLIVDATEQGDVRKVLILGLLYPITVFIAQGTYRLSGYAGMKTVTGIIKTSTDTLAEYTFQHSHRYFSDRFAGSIMNKYTNVTGAIGQIIPEILWTHLIAFVSFLVTFVFIILIDVRSGLLFVLLTVVLVLFNQRLAPKKRKLSLAHAELRTKLSGRVIDVLSNVSTVRQYTSANNELAGIFSLSDERRIAHSKNWIYTEKMLFGNSIILFIFATGMFWSLVTKWSAGQVTNGELVLILSLISQITGTLIFIGRAINETARSFGEMEEGLSDLIINHEIIDVPNAKKLEANSGEINWQDVTFTYGNNKVFDNFNLVIKPGQRVGLVGPSGAGKTTFVSLLLRQHDIDGGEIMIDGQNIAKVTQDSLREAIAVVPQEPMLFHRSIRENIAYGKPDATDEEIIEVAKKAQAHDFIMSLEEGYDTLVGERGVKLSGGQKQRVAIARAMLKDAPILVLDEATSALDSESEVAIQKALQELMEGKTVIAVAHRLSTLREMDRIIVLENGQIVEDGNHNELSNSGGTYQKLWEHQAGGFLQE